MYDEQISVLLPVCTILLLTVNRIPEVFNTHNSLKNIEKKRVTIQGDIKTYKENTPE